MPKTENAILGTDQGPHLMNALGTLEHFAHNMYRVLYNNCGRICSELKANKFYPSKYSFPPVTAGNKQKESYKKHL